MADDLPTQENKIMDIQTPPDTPEGNQVAPVETTPTPANTEVPPPPAPDTPLAPALGDKTPHHRGAPIGAIVAALVVALVLAGLTVYALKGAKKTATTSAPQKAATVKAADIDKTSKDIDGTLKQVNDTTDFSTNDLSDTTLGI